MITAQEMTLRLEESLLVLPEGFDIDILTSAISKASPMRIIHFLQEALALSKDQVFKGLKKKYPELRFNYSTFKKAFTEGIKLLDPREMYKEAKMAFKKYGFQIGLIFAIKNILTTFVIPPLLLILGFHTAALFVEFFPSNVIFVPLLIKYFGTEETKEP